MTKLAKILCGTLLACTAVLTPAFAMDVSYFQGMAPISAKSIKPYGEELMGDRVNLFDGSLQFEHTDLQLKGNNELTVALTRTLSVGRTESANAFNRQFGNWDLKLPRVGSSFGTKTGWVGRDGSGARCSKYWSPPWEYVDNTTALIDVPPTSYWQGTMLDVPGYGAQELLIRDVNYTAAPQDGQSYPLVTKQQWQVGCLSSVKNGAGEGFFAISPTGVRYDFDWMVKRNTDGVELGTKAVFPRQEVYLYASKVTDRFGNWVTYTFDSASPLLLKSIQASDGRVITVANSAGRATSVSDGTQTYSYSYLSGAFPALTTVTLPDGRKWTFNLSGLHPDYLGRRGNDEQCADGTSNMRPDIYSGTVTHPSGATGTFTLKYFLLTHADIVAFCNIQNGSARWDNAPNYATIGLSQKEISGPGIRNMRWTFDYSDQIPQSGCGNNDCYRIATANNPDGTITRTLYGNRWRINEGQLLFVQKGWNGTDALQTTAYKYADPAGQPFPASFGMSLARDFTDWFAPLNTPQQEMSVTQQGTVFANVVQSFDQYARPITVVKSGTAPNRVETTSYVDNAQLWVLSQVGSIVSGGQVISATEYNSRAQPTAERSFGILKNTISYHPDGTVASKSDGAGNTTYFSDYMRGIARNVSYPNGATETGEVNNVGLVTSVTDAAGYTTSFGYDPMGRLASITPPAGFTRTALTFEPVGFEEYGLAAGHWRQTITKGAAKTVIYFDALWRPTMTRIFDSENEAATRKVTVKHYDTNSRITFESYPQREFSSVAVTSPGTRTEYDAIGRPIRVESDSELGVLTTTSTYLPGFQTRTTNPRGHQTTQAFWALGSPNEPALSSISAPEGVSITIVRDLFGKPTSITRGGVSRAYVYDRGQRLCKTVEPEVGATIQAYDDAGNIAWKAPGQSFVSTSLCDLDNVAASGKISYSYDGLNQLLDTHYGDGSPSVHRTYWPDTKLKAIASNGSLWSYTYNAMRQLEGESLSFGGQIYNFVWSFNAAGDLSSLTYPNGGVVSYNPNALGEPTSVGSYAAGVTFHPNGGVASYTLGNGIVHTLTQNVRGLARVIRDVGVMQDQYDYDANGNVSSITDLQESGFFNRTMVYDGLDRLKSANAPGVWGAASYTYDAVDNITSAIVGSRSSTLGYDSNNRLSNVVTNGVLSIYGYDALGNIRNKGAQTFTFDLGNRLSASSLGGGYQYDGHGRRTRIVNNDGSSRVQIYGQRGQMLWAVSDDIPAPVPGIVNGYTCSTGNLSGTQCVTTSTYGATPNGYSCNTGDLLSGTTCSHTETSIYSAQVIGYSCAAGDSLSGSACYRTTVTSTYAAAPNFSCNAGDSLTGSTCSHIDVSAASPVYSCPAGYSLSGATCSRTTNSPATASSYTCNGVGSPFTLSGVMACMGIAYPGPDEDDEMRCQLSVPLPIDNFLYAARGGGAEIRCYYRASATYFCPSGSTLNGQQCASTISQPGTIAYYACASGTVSGSNCLKTSVYGAVVASYSCTAGDVLSGTTCSHSTSTTYPAAAAYTCNAGDLLNGDTCTHVSKDSYPAPVSAYACNNGDTLNGNICSHISSSPASPNLSCPNGSTLSGSSCLSSSQRTISGYLYLAGKQIAETKNGVVEYAHVDALGSPVARSSLAGTVVSRTKYEAFGSIAQGNKPNKAASVIGFTGHVQDAETELVYMQQRYYDPIAGRFLSVDPLVTDANTGKGFGLYTYVDNNPYTKVDPDGRDPEHHYPPGGMTLKESRAVEGDAGGTAAKLGALVAAPIIGAEVVGAKGVIEAVVAVARAVEKISGESPPPPTVPKPSISAPAPRQSIPTPREMTKGGLKERLKEAEKTRDALKGDRSKQTQDPPKDLPKEPPKELRETTK